MESRFWRTVLSTGLATIVVVVVGGLLLSGIVKVHFNLSTSDQGRTAAAVSTLVAGLLIVMVGMSMVVLAAGINTWNRAPLWPALVLTLGLALPTMVIAAWAVEFSNNCGPGHHVLTPGARETPNCFP